MPRKKKKPESHPEKSSFHEGLEGFDIKVNSFGQMETSFEIDKLNDFLNKQERKAKADASAEKASASKEAKAKEKGEGWGKKAKAKEGLKINSNRYNHVAFPP